MPAGRFLALANFSQLDDLEMKLQDHLPETYVSEELTSVGRKTPESPENFVSAP